LNEEYDFSNWDAQLQYILPDWIFYLCRHSNLEAAGWQLYRDQVRPTAAQQCQVPTMLITLGYSIAKLHMRCKRQFGVERFEWLTNLHHLHVLITDLEQRQKKSKEG
jgi:hypothetical protein